MVYIYLKTIPRQGHREIKVAGILQTLPGQVHRDTKDIGKH